MELFSIFEFLLSIHFESIVGIREFLYFSFVLVHYGIVLFLFTFNSDLHVELILLETALKLHDPVLQFSNLTGKFFLLVDGHKEFLLVLVASGGHDLQLVLEFVDDLQGIGKFQVDLVLASSLRSDFLELGAQTGQVLDQVGPHRLFGL